MSFLDRKSRKKDFLTATYDLRSFATLLEQVGLNEDLSQTLGSFWVVSEVSQEGQCQCWGSVLLLMKSIVLALRVVGSDLGL